MIKNILFDLGGVILDINYQETQKAFNNLAGEDFAQAYSQAKQTSLFDKFETGVISEEEFLETLSKMANTNEQEIKDAWCKMLGGINPDKVQYLKSLGKKFNIALFSNTNETHLKSFRDRLLSEFNEDVLESTFQKCFYSHIIGHRKPNPESFAYVLNQLNWKTQETLFIDDSLQHVEGARKAGLKAVLFDQNAKLNQKFLDIALSTLH